VILRIEVAQMAMRLNILLEQWFLRCKIGLGVKQMATAASGLSLLGTSTASAIGKEASLRPKTVLVDNLFHALEPPQIIGVVIWEIEGLWLTC